MLLTKEIEILWWNSTKKYWIEKGYTYTKQGETFIAKIEDLPPKSHVTIEFKCDYCGEIFPSTYQNYNRFKNIVNRDACKGCSHLKLSEIIFEKYGVTHIAKLETIAKKVGDKRRTKIDVIKNEFSEKNLLLLNEEYLSHKDELYFFCLKHLKDGIQKTKLTYFRNKNNYGVCNSCRYERMAQNIRVGFEEILQEFQSRNLTLLSDYSKYKNNMTKLEFLCNKHPDEVQKIAYGNLTQSINPCKFCHKESRIGENSPFWTGGKRIIKDYLRRTISQWKLKSASLFNYKCAITDERFNDIHHFYPFEKIVEETMGIANLEYRKRSGDYSVEELLLIEKICIDLHRKYGFGIPLSREVHKKFHNIYGRKNTTFEQFREFINTFYPDKLHQFDEVYLFSGD